MRIRLDEAFDGGAWPGPAAATGASAGEVWQGFTGFLNTLEVALGLHGPPQSQGVREAALVPVLRAHHGFWSASAEVDPLHTAQRLLGWRDLLMLHGWRGEPVAPRLSALARVTRDVLPGIPDRLNAVLAALATRNPEFERVELLEPVEALPRQWAAVLEALAAHGTTVFHAPLAAAEASGDLQSARTLGFIPVGDGTLQLLRARAPMEAADETAAFLAALPSLDGVVVIGGDTVLDAALRRHGVPTLGAHPAPEDNALLQLLPLVLALAWRPADPRRALELLTLPLSPVPPSLARRLTRALHDAPALDSDPWRTALAEGLEAIEDHERREKVTARLEALFESTLPVGAHYPVAEVRRRVTLLQQWIRGRLANEPERPDFFTGAMSQCLTLEELVSRSGLTELPEALLRRYVEQATSAAGAASLLPAQAGISAVPSPGAVAGPARVLVWWNFTRASAPPPARNGLRVSELTALAEAGVSLPSAGELAARAARRDGRALAQATQLALLVSPQVGPDATASHAHPLWDEVQARCGERERLTLLEVERPRQTESLRGPRALRPGVRPAREWSFPPGAVQRREVESPSSAETLVGCSLKWVLTYAGGLSSGATGELPGDVQLLGTVAHAILARIFEQGAPTPEEAEAQARALFDSEGPRMAATLFLRGAGAEQERARQVTARAAHELARLLHEGGWTVESVEQPVQGEGLGGAFRGTPDLVVRKGRRQAVIDLKWDGLPYRRGLLEEGTALQLSAYAHLVQREGWPEVGYFILRRQRLLSTSESLAGADAAVPGPDSRETWQAFEAATAAVWTGLHAGKATATAVVEAGDEETLVPEETTLVDGELAASPPCRFCDLGMICGRSVGGL